eukprot:scaffold15267_cov118-Isochrysis_galbana.AAC.7
MNTEAVLRQTGMPSKQARGASGSEPGGARRGSRHQDVGGAAATGQMILVRHQMSRAHGHTTH